jgi:hypothetical protein
MRNRILTVIFVLSFSIVSFSQTGKTRLSFGIYLTQLSEEDIQKLERHPLPIESIPLQPMPLISERDIVEYDFSTHIIKLTPDAFERISKIKVQSVSAGIPFVVSVSGRNHYMGMFWSSFSSIPTAFPNILMPPIIDEITGINSIQIRPPNMDRRVTPYMVLKELGLLKKGQ